MAKRPSSSRSRIRQGAVAAADLAHSFPRIDLPIRPPYRPMEAKSIDAIPSGDFLYEPKWDGFRCLAFRKGSLVVLQSKAGQPLARYFPEVVAALQRLPQSQFVLDGEIVVFDGQRLDFDALLQRIHPAESRIKRLARETPATYLAFDLLVDARGRSLTERPLYGRRESLQQFFVNARGDGVRFSPATTDFAQAERWLRELASAGLDGVIAKRRDCPYLSGDRSGMHKIKRMRTADCVVGGYRMAQKGGKVGSLLLGLHDDSGRLNHVGFSASFTAAQRDELRKILAKYAGGEGFTGSAPGGPSRWSQGRETAWVPLQPRLVCEVRYDHFSGDRFRHGTRFLRWRPEKDPRQCTYEQVRPAGKSGLRKLLAA
ncbi:MAG TPA: ATP-dependent DNA ligase [Terriglobales bacterium]|nr:ATP-dependent DNA ligase [Terriglobales bacterium]